MRVVQVIGGGERGGSREHVIALCRGIARHRPGIDARLVCLIDGPVAASAREQGVACTVLPTRGPAGVRAVGRLRRHLEEIRPAIVHTHGVRANVIGRLAARSLPAALVTTVHSSVRADHANPVKRFLSLALERATRQATDRFIAVSGSIAAELARDGVPPERIAVVYNSVGESRAPAPGAAATLREQLGIGADRPIVMGVGRLEAVKDPAMLLRVFAALQARLPFQGVVVGSGSLDAAMRRTAAHLGLEPFVRFLGFRRDAPQLIAQADVLVVTSRMEGAPLVLLEAMRGGTPVVASDVGGNREVIERAQNGFLVPQPAVERYVERIEGILRDHGLAARLSARGAGALERIFSSDAFVSGTLAAYDAARGVSKARRAGVRARRAPRVTIAGYYGAGNLGDEAILAGMLEALREEGLGDCTVLSFDPAETARLHGVPSLHIGRRAKGLLRILRQMWRTDLFILGGGGLLQDQSPRVVPFWLSRAWLARCAGVPVMYYSLGVGPLATRAARWLVGAMPGRRCAITVRDEASARLLRECGVGRPAIEVLADPALGLDPAGMRAEAPVDTARRRPCGCDVVAVAVCLRPVKDTDALATAVADCLRELGRLRPVRYLIVPLHARDDPRLCGTVARRLAIGDDPPACSVVAAPESPRAFATLLGGIDAVVSMRLHGLVLAARQGIPVFGLACDPKIDRFLDRSAAGSDVVSVADVCRRPGHVAGRLAGWLDERRERAARARLAAEDMAPAARRAARIARRLVRPDHVRILDQRIHVVDLAGAVQRVARGIDGGRRQFVVAHNPEKIIRSLQDPELAHIVEHVATLVTADGVGTIAAARLLGFGRIPRVTGIDLFRALLAEAEARGRRVFLYGGTPAVCDRASVVVRRDYPDLVLAGAEHGYEAREDVVLARIRAARPDYLFVALGSPAQEKWIARHLDRLPPCCAMGIGGSLDVLAGAVARAPAFMRRAGAEWLFRLAVQPARMDRMKALPRFVWRVVRAASLP